MFKRTHGRGVPTPENRIYFQGQGKLTRRLVECIYLVPFTKRQLFSLLARGPSLHVDSDVKLRRQPSPEPS